MLSGWPNKSRFLDEPMSGELLKAAVWGSIWRPQGGLGTLEQIHPPPCSLPGCPPASPPTAPGRARPSELTARGSDRAEHDDRSTQGTIALALARRSRPYEFATSQKIRTESTEAGPAAAEPATNRVADPQETPTSCPVQSNHDVESGNAWIREAQGHICV